MFAARVDSDRLLEGTTVAAEFGQSPFAIARGARVESIGRANGYAVTVNLLRTHFAFGIDEVVALDMRKGFPPNLAGMAQRAKLTAASIHASLAREPRAPNIIGGAVLAVHTGRFDAYLEADGIGAKAGPVFHVNEFKGWPLVDGRADDAGKLGETIRQMGIYRYLLTDAVERLGGKPEAVSPAGLLITPHNVGMTLVGTPVDLGRATAVAATTLANLPDPIAFADAVAPGTSFRAVAEKADPEPVRLSALATLTEAFGTNYQDSCLTNCGLARFCRLRAWSSSDPRLAGATARRFMPDVASLRRAAELADGAAALTNEIKTGAAGILARAGAEYRAKSMTVLPRTPPSANRHHGTAA